MSRISLLVVLTGAVCIEPTLIQAQTPPVTGTASGDHAAADKPGQPSPAASTELQEIVVTGTRIATPLGATTPTPVTVLDTTTLQKLGITNVGAGINQLPQFLNDAEPTQTLALSPQNIGSQILDLRGLGAASNPASPATRTLVLVDGRRFVPSTQTGAVDVSLVPSVLVERTEVVTGGASAVYGSDAVAGVVNIVLNHQLDGVVAQVQHGQAQAGDNHTYQASLAAGGDIGSVAHVVGGIEYERNSGQGDVYSRPWSAGEWQQVNNSNATVGGANGPFNLILPHTHTSMMTPGGLILGGPLNDYYFNHDGSVSPFELGTNVGGLFMTGGQGYGQNAFFVGPMIQPQYSRYSLYSHADFKLEGPIHPFLEASFGSVTGHNVGAQMRAGAYPPPLQIQTDNPFVPAPVRDALTAAGQSSFLLGRDGQDIGPTLGESDTKTARVVVGAKGELPFGWTWDSYYQYGRNQYDQYERNDLILANLYEALDAVVGPAGNVVCRSALSNPASACQPLNLLGENNFSPQAKAYITGTATQHNVNDQHVASLSLQGKLWDLPAGELRAATGVEYRVEGLSGTTDPISQANGFTLFNGQNIHGVVHVLEGFAEADVPILKDLPLAKSLSLNAAIRDTDYSTSGSVASWKVGAVYEPVKAVLLRGTHSRDIRAPNEYELFSPLNLGQVAITDPTTGAQSLIALYTGGNGRLQPEIGNTTTGGIVFTPEFAHLSGLTISLDYYEVTIKNVIAQPNPTNIVGNCAAGNQAECALITRNASGAITAVTGLYANLNKLFARGVDLELDYTHRLPGQWGSLNLRYLANYASDLTLFTNNGLTAVNTAGSDAFSYNGYAGVPRYQATTILNWDRSPWSVTLQTRYIRGGTYDNTLIGPGQPGYQAALSDPVRFYSTINNNHVDGRTYVNLSASYDVIESAAHQLQVYGVINNLFDKDPPIAPGAASSTNGMLFDQAGRVFMIGMRYRH